MAKGLPSSSCRRMRDRNGHPWYCCCGRKKGGDPDTTYCACAPMVGKNKVNVRGERRFRVTKGGRVKKGW